jgi:hypothetical protein
VGHHSVTASCGQILNAPVDVVLTTDAEDPPTLAAVLVALLLLIVGLTHRELFRDGRKLRRP